MQRRNFLAGLAAIFAMAPAFPAVKSQKGDAMTRLLDAGEAETKRVLLEPFLSELATGNLPKDAFAWYLAQNLSYLQNYAECFDALATRLSESDRSLARRWSEETRATYDWTVGLFTTLFGNKPQQSDFFAVRPTTLAYMRHERTSIASPSIFVAFAALLPCFTVYDRVGRMMVQKRVLNGNPYAEWVGAYGSPDYVNTVSLATGLAERLGQNASRLEIREGCRAYVESCRFERRFFAAAYAKERVPESLGIA